jgi:Sec-independent protein translocase protein TatA
MLALIGNLSLGETIVIAVLAILIFGDRLPQVAARAYGQIRKLRRTVDDVRRETGIDRELRQLRTTIQETSREARVDDPFAKQAPARKPTYEVTEAQRSDEAKEAEADDASEEAGPQRGPGPDQGSSGS